MSVYRTEALAEQAAPPRGGDVVRTSPGWIDATYWVVVGFVVFGLGFAVFGRVDTYSRGHAIVRSFGTTDVNAAITGTVAAVTVGSGQRVEAGQVIVQLDDRDERDELAQLQRRHEAAVLRSLAGSAEPTVDVAATRGELERARAAVAARQIVAPADGVIQDVRVAAGQRVELGEVLVTLSTRDDRTTLWILLPGGDRPLLASGASVRFELAGHPHTYHHGSLDEIGETIVGPAEARRMLGPGIADALALDGPLVLARAELDRGFAIDGARHRYHDGMLAVAEVHLRDEPLLMALLPGLRRPFAWLGGDEP